MALGMRLAMVGLVCVWGGWGVGWPKQSYLSWYPSSHTNTACMHVRDCIGESECVA